MSTRLLPWLFPVGVLVAVLIVAFVGSVILGIIWLLISFVGLPLVWREWERGRQRR